MTVAKVKYSTSIRTATLPALFADIPETAIITVTGHWHTETLHDAARDTYGATGFLCHSATLSKFLAGALFAYAGTRLIDGLL